MVKPLSVLVFLLMVMLPESSGSGPSNTSRGKNAITPSFFEHCVFISVDFQESKAPEPVTDENLPKAWKKMGFSAADVNAASDFARRVALSNAVKVAELCRALGMPRIFIHWGYLFEDAMDLDPEVRKAMQEEHGTEYTRYSGHIRQPESQPAKAFNLQPGDYVLPKAAQDAFSSCNIDFVLRNLKVKNIIFVHSCPN